MLTYQGKSVFGGIAIGKIRVYRKNAQTVKRVRVEDPQREMERFLAAKETAAAQLKSLYDKACREVGEDNAAIFEIHQMMLDDADYLESIENIIKNQSLGAEYAVAATGENFAQMFASMDDAYMQARAADVKDISERLLRILSGREEEQDGGGEPMILAAEDLAPSETVQLDKSKVLAFVTVKGSANSHTAILARTMNIPAIIGADLPLTDESDGKTAVVDGFSGKIYVDPEPELLKEMQARLAQEKEKKRLLQTLKGKENVTLDGKRIQVYANIGNSRDLALVLSNDAGGIGLFRSEFLYLERDTFPTEEEQFVIYKQVAETMAGKKVIIRTLDIGADKQADYFGLAHEENPAMGLRAIRLCLTRPEIFKTQLRALFRAAAFGNLSVMYPMITSVAEMRKIQAVVQQVTEELTADGVPFMVPEQGIMIETPAAVMISDLLAKEAAFFSIGTNDLSQYTMAIDRQNPSLDDFFEPHSEAVLRMIQMTVENGHKEGIWVGICGELGADLDLTQTFLKMGVDELSVSPGRVLPLRQVIRQTDTRKL
ncbi:phosphoenolpyruvate--protein phosphotransferase [Ructibacterium gallinarum]|uniref:Phosphoenolpyruvate-protein phosphotransferase n=1 Tax=Ructibacterium gallinarum TaxID=2779355 RepID=A0A9D5M1X5_9FIRM|nr:phosphoenolpyruvate--protein phosphotransferase [Ructibacterium gallinarum]MBE5039095.1 phosphoenolpyruvate--protein phosphotransferase [Ructibacterium gallinarum]